MITVAILKAWLRSAWAWLKAKWKTLVVPAALGIGWAITKLVLRRKVTVVSPELASHQKVRVEAEEKAQGAIDASAEKRDSELSDVEREYAEAQKRVTESQASQADELRGDSGALSAYLRGVGNRVRDKDGD